MSNIMDIQADPSLDYAEADETRPAKRVKLDGALGVTEDVQEEIVDDDDWDDVYGDSEPAAVEVEAVKPSATEQVVGSMAAIPSDDEAEQDQVNAEDALPEQSEQSVVQSLQLAPPGDFVEEETMGEEEKASDDGVPADAIEDGDALVDEEHYVPAEDQGAVGVLEEVSAVNGDPDVNLQGEAGHTDSIGELVQPATSNAVVIEDTEQHVQAEMAAQSNAQAEQSGLMEGDSQPTAPRATDDAEFMAAAAAQKDDAKAEWNFDSSDAESSSDSDSDSDDSSDSDSDSEGGYEMLDAATAAKILMQEEGGEDDDGKGKKSGADRQPRTANEVKDEVVPKPAITITDDMKITELGHVERAVESMVLVKGATPGEYQVLESGSLLCNEKRDVIGVVAETLGRVQEPMYSVAFTNAKEIEDAGLEHGVRVYYVNQHSTFVFTQPLKNLKGTDASNINDEEVAEDELEFSDDEAEAEHKRQKKAAKKAGRGGMSGAGASRGGYAGDEGPRSFGVPGHDSGETYVNGSDAPQQTYGGGGLSYDDEPTEEFYSPLKRPDNLSQMMASGGGPPPPRPQLSGGFERGRGRGRGDRGRGRGRGDRGRGDRGRGRGGFHNDRNDRGGGFHDRNQRGGHQQDRGERGGHQQDRNERGGGRGGQPNGGHRGNAHSFPDRHNGDRQNGGGRQHSLPPRPPHSAQGSPPPAAQPTPQQYPAQYAQHQQQQHQPQTYAQPSYQFNGYTFQNGNPPPAHSSPAQAQQSYAGYTPAQQAYQPQQPPATPSTGMPAGAYVNPAFFQNQQLPPQQAGYGAWGQQQAQPNPQAHQYGQAVQGQGYGVAPGYGAPQAPTAPTAQQQANLADILRRMGGQG